ncbi:MAG TPA: hypothetical protein VGP33_13750 [Chloroflexota bacterium]|jgi:hypothetical protein|nr:hypothetical protein [Chloroflexota bacterium]
MSWPFSEGLCVPAKSYPQAGWHWAAAGGGDEDESAAGGSAARPDGEAVPSACRLPVAADVAADGLPAVSADTLWEILWQAGGSRQRDRIWRQTGMAVRERRQGTASVST